MFSRVKKNIKERGTMSKKILSLLVCLVMLLTTFGAFAESEYPEYLNLDSYYPFVKEGFEEELSFGIVVTTDFSEDPNSRYFWTLMKEVFNLNCKIIQVTNKDEYVTLSFAADDLPDIMVGVALTTTQLVNYGMLEGQLLNIEPYLSEELTPQLCALFEEYPEIKAGITTPDGAIYTVPYIMNPNNPTLYSTSSINMTMLEEAGFSEKPHTLEEMIDVLYAFKELGDDVIPLAGAWEDGNAGAMILKALGYETSIATADKICLKAGEVVLPGADEGYLDYLKLMNQFYNDGIIEKDYFTNDLITLQAEAAEKRLGVLGSGSTEGYSADPTFFQQYESVPAMTSANNDKPVAVKRNFWNAGGCVVSAKTEHPELCLRWIDWMMTTEGTHAAWVGAHKNNETLMLDGWGGWNVNENYSRMDVDRETYPDKWTGAVEYLRQEVAGFNMGSLGYVVEEDNYRQSMSGLEPRPIETVWVLDPNNASFYWRTSADQEYTELNEVDISYFLYFFDEDTNDRLIELESLLSTHIESETAKFITGARSLDEFDAYMQEMRDLGAEEYLGYYADAYATYLENLAAYAE